MSIKRSFTVTVTFKQGYGEALSLTGKEAQNFWTQYTAYLRGDVNGARGIVITNEGTQCGYMFDSIASACRSKQTETEYADDECQDLTRDDLNL